MFNLEISALIKSGKLSGKPLTFKVRFGKRNEPPAITPGALPIILQECP